MQNTIGPTTPFQSTHKFVPVKMGCPKCRWRQVWEAQTEGFYKNPAKYHCFLCHWRATDLTRQMRRQMERLYRAA